MHPRFHNVEDALEQALVYVRQNDHDRVLLCLAYALSRTSRARQRPDGDAKERPAPVDPPRRDMPELTARTLPQILTRVARRYAFSNR